MTLDGHDGFIGVDDRLTLGQLADKTLAFLDSFEQRLLEEAQKAPADSILSASDEVRKARKAVRQSHNAAYTLKQLCLRI